MSNVVKGCISTETTLLLDIVIQKQLKWHLQFIILF